MFNFFKRCIFCYESLPEEPQGDGEHVIPRNIFGFWRIHDVCEKCKEYFGEKIDQLSLQDVQVLSAIHSLQLPKADLYFDSLPYLGSDTVDGRKVKMIRKGGRLKTKAQYLDTDFFECAEDDWERIGIEWMRKDVGKEISEDDFNKESERLRNDYQGIKTGEIIHSDLLGYSVRKRTVTDIQVDLDKLPSISKLIAKIVFSFLHYMLSREQILNIREYLILRDHARYDGELKKYTINWCPLVKKVSYHRFHRIWLWTLSNSNTFGVDTTFFGYPSWRTIFSSNIPIVLKDHRGKRLDEVSLIFDFKDLHNRVKHIGFKYNGRKDFQFFELAF